MPQYGQWQDNQNGAWRRMEIAVHNASVATPTQRQVLVVACDYPSGVTMVTPAERIAFENGEKLRHFTDPRIPHRFRVWVVPHTWTAKAGTAAMSTFFAAASKLPLFEPMFTALSADVAPVFEETITEMPAIDREYWKAQMLNARVRQAYAAYTDQQAQQLAHWNVQQTSTATGNRPARSTRRGASTDLKPADPLSLAKWAQNSQNREAVVTWLKTTSQLAGWSNLELAQLQSQHIESARFK